MVVFFAGQLVAVTPQVAVLDVRALLDRGLFQDAEALAISAVEQQPSADVQSLNDLVEALVRNGRGAEAATLNWANRAVELASQVGVSESDEATAVRNLGDVHVERGDLRDGVSRFERALAMLGDRDATGPAVVGILVRVARALVELVDFDAAMAAAERAVQMSGVTEDWQFSLADALEIRGRVWQLKDDHAKASVDFERAQTIRERSMQRHPAHARSLRLLGEQRWHEGKLQSSRETVERALTLAESTLRSGHPEIAEILKSLSMPLVDLGDLDESQQHLERALSIVESAYGPAHPRFAALANDLANTHVERGEYARARGLYERAREIYTRRFGPGYFDATTALFNSAFIPAALGDLVEARRLFERSIRDWTTLLGPTHAVVAYAQHEYGQVLADQGRLTDARRWLDRAHAIRVKTLGEEHQLTASTAMALAKVLARQGNRGRATTMVAASIERLEKAGDVLGVADGLLLQGQLLSAAHRGEDARPAFERSVALRVSALGAQHPAVAEATLALARELMRSGSIDESLVAAGAVETVGRNHLRLMLQSLSERQALTYAAKRPRGLDVMLTLAASGDLALAEVGRSRALVLDELIARRRVARQTDDPETRQLWARLERSRQRLANLTVRGAGGTAVDRHTQFLAEARRARDEAEQALAEGSTSFGAERRAIDVDTQALRQALPLNAALVSFVRYDRAAGLTGQTAPRTVRSEAAAQASYVAFVLHANQTVVEMVQLGAASQIDAAIAAWRRALQPASPGGLSSESALRRYGSEVRKLIWDPLAMPVADAETVFVVPDGVLNVVPLAALPMADGRYLVDQGPAIHYLSAERDLLAYAAQTSTRETSGMLAFGGAAFDSAAHARPSPVLAEGVPAPLITTRGEVGCDTLGSHRFLPLAATGREAAEIAALWDGFASGSSDVRVGDDATEAVFKALARGRRMLHVATHGFFLDGGCAPVRAGTRAVGGLARPTTRPAPGVDRVPAPLDNPLLLSGLALAGANRRHQASPTDEDGILTAEEVASLDLEGTDWVVLSACDTGLGEIRAGEGVLGLRRAFQIAGARTVIMSLWSVEDESTRRWMSALYRGRLREGDDTPRAVREASLEVLRERRAAGLSTHPFYWAAFVAAGDWH